MLCRYLLKRESGNASTVTRVFDSDAADVALSIDIQECVFVQIPRFGHFGRPKLDVQRISVLEIFDLHCLKDLSKNALWTVSPSDKSITRRYFPSIFRNWRPSTDAPVRLNHFLHGLVYRTLNPFQLDDRPVRSGRHFLEIPRKFHGLALREWTSQSSVSA